MEIEIGQTQGVTVVLPRGGLDFSTAEPMKRALTALLENGQSKLVIDMSEVAYIDSSGLGILVSAMKRARAAGGDLRICALQEDVRASLVITGLVKQIAVHRDRQESIASWE